MFIPIILFGILHDGFILIPLPFYLEINCIFTLKFYFKQNIFANTFFMYRNMSGIVKDTLTTAHQCLRKLLPWSSLEVKMPLKFFQQSTGYIYIFFFFLFCRWVLINRKFTGLFTSCYGD